MIDARPAKLATVLDAPNAQSWQDLTALLLAWEVQPGFDAALVTASERLDGWPDRLRTAEGARGSAVRSLARSCDDAQTTDMGE
ncbi:MAG: hypothetical protein U0414_25110 [Polyangiaceae bacterium]